MLDLLPALPDQATLAAMPSWAAIGAAIGLGAWIFNRIAERNMRFGREDSSSLPAVEVPGAELDKEPDWTSPKLALKLTMAGALVGAFVAWPIAAPLEDHDKFELLAAAFGLFAAMVALTRLLRDRTAVGEAPPEDPENTVARRLPGVALDVAFAVFMLAVAWFALA